MEFEYVIERAGLVGIGIGDANKEPNPPLRKTQ